MNGQDDTAAPPGGDAFFQTTHWSVVLAASNSASSLVTAALEQLCKTYWYPLYAYVRRRGYRDHDAQDLTQSYFAQLLRRDSLRDRTPGMARFRSFLLATMKNFLADEHARATALKRGGGQVFLSVDAQEAEHRYLLEPVHDESPEILFDRQWATTVLNEALRRLEREGAADERPGFFTALSGCILQGSARRTYADIAAEFALTEEAVKKAAQRMRQRVQVLIRDEVARTVGTAADVETELNYLRASLRES